MKKADEREKKFNRYIGDILTFWFYQYTEHFHCQPETITDMIKGLKYLYYKKGE